MPTPTLRRGLVAALALVIAVAAAPSAAAHTQLLRSTPGDGQTVEHLDQVELEFSGALLEVGSSVVLEDESGDSIELPTTVRQATTLTAPVPQEALAEGTMRLRWRVVAEDGHPIEGVIRFRYRAPEGVGGAEPTATAEPETQATASAQPSATASEPAATATAASDAEEPAATDDAATPSPTPSASDEATENNDEGTGAVWIIAALVAVAAGAAATVAWRRRGGTGS